MQQEVDKYDVVIVGSDQVFRFPEFRAYLMDFGSSFSGRKIAYAACCGSPDVSRYAEVKNLINNFEKLSVRTEFSYRCLTDASHRGDIITVVDPTCLVDLDEIGTSIPNLPKNILSHILWAKRSVVDINESSMHCGRSMKAYS